MRDVASIPQNVIWGLSYGSGNASVAVPLVSIIDLTTLKIVASSTLPLSAPNAGLSVMPCMGAFVTQLITASQNGFFNLLRSGAVAQSDLSFLSGVSVIACAWDSTNSRLAVLTSTTVAEIAPATLTTAWSTSHGLTPNAVGSIDADRNGNVAIAANGTVQVYNGGSGVQSASFAQAGAATLRYDAEGNLFVAGTDFSKYNSALVNQWTFATTYSALSVGDQFIYGQVDTGTGSEVDTLNLATGELLGFIATLSSPCAIPGGRFVALSNSLGFTGPMLVLIDSGGFASAQGDLLAAWESVTGGPTYVRAGRTILEPGVGRIGAFAW
jgi:hypothetical protein